MLRFQHLIVPQTKDKHFHLILEVKIFDKDLSKWQSDCQWQNSRSLLLCLSSDLSDGYSTTIHTNPYYPSVLSFGMNWHYQCRKLSSKSSTVLLQYFIILWNQSNWWITLFTLFSFKKKMLFYHWIICLRFLSFSV